MTLSDILADLYRRLGYASSPASEVTTRLTAFVNQAHRQLLSDPSLGSLRNDTTTFASVAGTSRYALPPSVAVIEAITDRTTSLRLTAISQDELRAMDPGLLDNGIVTHYAMQGQAAVAVQPSTAATIYIKSTSASDTQTGYIEGFRTGGYPFSTSVTLTGTTAAALSGSFSDVLEITKVYLSSNAVGTVTVHQGSGVGTELARFGIGQAITRYQAIQLWPTPNAAITYYVDYVRVIPNLIQTADQPILPDDFHWMLVEGALVSEWSVKDDSRMTDARQAYRQGLRDLKYRVSSPPDYLPVASGRRSEMSRLGRWYPDGAGVR